MRHISDSELGGSPTVEECEIYHDEIKDDGNNPVAHGFLIVPLRSKAILLEDLRYIRKKHGVPSHKINFKNLSGRTRHPSYGCARDWLKCLIDGMAKTNYRIRSTQRLHMSSLNIRFSAIFMKSLHILSDECWTWTNERERGIRKFETLLRIGLKGGLRYLYSPAYRIKVTRFTTDAGAFHRPLNEKRIIERLKAEMEPNINLAQINAISSCVSHHRSPQCTDKDAANLLQLCDLMLGSTSFNCIKSNHEQKLKITENVRALLDKRGRGPGFRHSSHFKTFSITSADIVDGKWTFSPLKTIPPQLPIADAKILT